MIEKEYKLLTTQKKQFELFKDDFIKTVPLYQCKRRLQVNYYYDTPDFLLWQNNTVLRARRVRDNLVLQVKTEQAHDSRYRIASEREQPLDKLTLFLSGEDIGLPIAPFYQWLGELTTDRTRCFVTDGLTVDFDISYYCGKMDYEIEMEYSSQAEKTAQELIALFERYAAPNANNGKYTRFVKAYRKIRA
jgi:uncharacterized protein YjbK